MRAVSAPATPPTTCPSCGAWPSTSCAAKTTAKGGIAARRKQAGWNDGYLLKVLSNENVIALPKLRDAAPAEPV